MRARPVRAGEDAVETHAGVVHSKGAQDALLHGLAAPFLRPFRRVIPPIANVDLSPLVLLLVLQIVLMLLGGVRNGFAPLLFGA